MYEQGGEAALQDISRKKPILAYRVDPSVDAAVIAHAIDQPADGQHRVSHGQRYPCGRSVSLPAPQIML